MGSQAASVGGRASSTPRLTVPVAVARPRLMSGMRVMRPRMSVQNRGPRTSGQRPGERPRMAGFMPRLISPGQNMRPPVGMANQSYHKSSHMPSASLVPQTDEWEDPSSDPLAQESATPSLTFQGDADEAPSSLSGPPTGVKRPRMMTNGQSGFKASPGPMVPRMCNFPALATRPPVWGGAPGGQRLATRPLFRSVSKPFQMHQSDVEVITMEEEVDNIGEVLLKIPSNITIVRQKDEVSLAKEARGIGELMIRVANKLAEGGGALAVTRDVLDAQKMINSMRSRLQ